MRAYDTIKHKEEIDKICRQLRFINKETLSKKNDEALGKVGDVRSLYIYIYILLYISVL